MFYVLLEGSHYLEELNFTDIIIAFVIFQRVYTPTSNVHKNLQLFPSQEYP